MGFGAEGKGSSSPSSRFMRSAGIEGPIIVLGVICKLHGHGHHNYFQAFESPSKILPAQDGMLGQELSQMDRVTQLQDAIEEVCLRFLLERLLLSPSILTIPHILVIRHDVWEHQVSLHRLECCTG